MTEVRDASVATLTQVSMTSLLQVLSCSRYTLEYQCNAMNVDHEMGPQYKWYCLILTFLSSKYNVLYTHGVHVPIVL